MQAESGNNVYLAQAKLMFEGRTPDPFKHQAVTYKLRSNELTDGLRPQARPGLGKVPSALHICVMDESFAPCCGDACTF